MSIQAQKVISWPHLDSTVEHWNKIVKKFCALGATVYADDGDGLLHGQVLWGVQAADQSVGMASDWREVVWSPVGGSRALTSLLAFNPHFQASQGKVAHLKADHSVCHVQASALLITHSFLRGP